MRNSVDKLPEALLNNVSTIAQERMMFEHASSLSKKYEEALSKYSDFYPVVKELAQDIFVSLINTNPELEPIDRVSTFSYLNRNFLEPMIESLAFQRSVAQINNDVVSAAYMTPTLLDSAMQTIIKASGGEKELKAIFKGMGPGGGKGRGGKPGKGIQDKLRKLAEKIRKEAQKKSSQYAQQIRNEARVIRGVQMLNEMFDINCGDGKATYLHMDPNSRIQAAMRFLSDERMIKLLDMLGRMKDIIQTANARSSQSLKIRRTEVCLTGDIQRALPSELMYAGLEGTVLAMLPFMKMADHALLGTRDVYSGEQMGPVVICLDSSGSMVGEFDFWAKAVALCAVKHALDGERTAHAILFSCAKEDMVEFTFAPGKKLSSEKFIEFAKLCLAGGTAFEPPLERAMEIIKGSHEDLIHADIIFLTDGYAGITSEFAVEFKEFKKKNKVKMVSFGVSSYDCEDLMKVSDFYRQVANFDAARAVSYGSDLMTRLPTVSP